MFVLVGVEVRVGGWSESMCDSYFKCVRQNRRDSVSSLLSITERAYASKCVGMC